MDKYSLGSTITGEVVSIQPYGAFVKLDESIVGLLHISEISIKYVKDVNDCFKIGQKIKVKVIAINKEENQIKLSYIKRSSKKTGTNLADECFNEDKEFLIVKENLSKFIEKTKERFDLK